MNKRGYVLIEVLVASVLLSLAGSSLYMGLMEGMKVDQRIRESNAVYDPLRRFWVRFEKDLRNSVALREDLYRGKQDEMSFPVLLMDETKAGKFFTLHHIRYFIKDSKLMRSDQELSTALVKKDPAEKMVLAGIKSLKFQYAYLDEKEQLLFQPFWLEDPYFGIPKAVKVDVDLNKGGVFSKFMTVPQGRWGHMQEKTG